MSDDVQRSFTDALGKSLALESPETLEKAAYKRGLEKAAKIVDYNASICTYRLDRQFLEALADLIRAKIQELDDE